MSNKEEKREALIHLYRDGDGLEVRVEGSSHDLIKMLAHCILKNEMFEDLFVDAFEAAQKVKANKDLN